METIWLTVEDIHRRTGIDPRALRYVVDHKVVDPGRYQAKSVPAPRRGVPRGYSVFAAFILSCAALLRAGGLQRRTVCQIMDRLFEWAGAKLPVRSRMLEAFKIFAPKLGPLSVEIADGTSMRISSHPPESGAPSSRPSFDERWRCIATWVEMPAKYVPLVLCKVDLAELRSRLRD